LIAPVFTLLALAVGCAPHNDGETVLSSASVPAQAAAPAAAPTRPVEVESPPEAPATADALPSTCAGEASVKDTKACLPPPTFAKRLCSGIYPEVALGMFAKGTPWTRLWLAGNVEAWNAAGGLTTRTQLAFDEEVLVLARHGAANTGIVMTGAQASFDVLRWDGTCVSVMDGELTARRPPTPKPAPIPWSHLEEKTRHALLSSPKVKATHESLGTTCSSVTSTKEKKSCDKADKAFSRAVVDYVRNGATLPTPARRP
jgi:hypothetical protein